MNINWNDSVSIYKVLTEMCDAIDSAEEYSQALAIQNNLESLLDEYSKNVPDEIAFNMNFLLGLIHHSGRLYHFVPLELVSNKTLILALFSTNKTWKMCYKNQGLYSFYSPEAYFKQYKDYWKQVFDDKDFVIQALRVRPSSFELVSDRLKDDPEIQKLSLNLDIYNMRYIPKYAHVDKGLAISYVSENGWGISDLPSEYDNDPDILYAAVNENPFSFRDASQHFRKDEAITIKLIKEYNVPYDEADDSMLESPSFILEMLKLFGTKVLKDVHWEHKSFQNNYTFAKEIVKITPNGYAYLPNQYQNDSKIMQIKLQSETEALNAISHKTDTEKMLDKKWDSFLHKLFVSKKMNVKEFQTLFYDTFWYFRNREDTHVLNAGGWHILSCLSALKNIPIDFHPGNCMPNEFNAARCLCEDLLYEINYGMPGRYTEDSFAILLLCVPPAGCSQIGVYMTDFESFQYTFNDVVGEFDSFFSDWREEYYSERYGIVGYNCDLS